MKYEYEEKENLALCPDCKFYYDIESNNEYGFFCCEECAEIKIAEFTRYLFSILFLLLPFSFF